MNDTNNDLDQTAEEILTYTVSDEVLEAAAGTGRGEPYPYPSLVSTYQILPYTFCC